MTVVTTVWYDKANPEAIIYCAAIGHWSVNIVWRFREVLLTKRLQVREGHSGTPWFWMLCVYTTPVL